MIMGSPLWQRGVRGDFINIFDSIGVLVNEIFATESKIFRDKSIHPLDNINVA
jgi:hypothetical protein